MNKTLLAFVAFFVLVGGACQNPASTTTGPANPTITYQGNGGTTLAGLTTVADTTTYNNGATATLATNSFLYTGYNFSQWNTKADGSGSSYAAGGSLTLKDNLVLYAIWTAKTQLEILDGLNNLVKTQYELSGTTKRSLKEWSTSWSSTGVESTDYYAEYTYSASVDKVIIYSNETAKTLVGTYEYTKDAAGNIVKAVYYNGTGAIAQQWTATYNAQGRYLTYLYLKYDSAGASTVTDSRACTYAPDGIHYIKEVYFDGSGTDEATDLAEKYVPTYENNDPTTGKILKEVRTTVQRATTTVSDGNETKTPETINVSTYLFSWAGSDYIYQMAHISDSGVILETYNYTYASIASSWLKTSSMYLVDNVANSLEKLSYNPDSGDMTQDVTYDLLNGTQMSDKVLSVYSKDTTGNLFKTVKTYAYTVTRGVDRLEVAPPAFKTLAPAYRH